MHIPYTYRWTVAVALYVLALLPVAQAEDNDGLLSLRGKTPFSATSAAPSIKQQRRDTGPIARNYKQQPPLIPHPIRGYQVDKRYNKCLSCHGPGRSKLIGAPPVSRNHFLDRDGRELKQVARRRYFCPQCHVPQKDTPPLVGNTFHGGDQDRDTATVTQSAALKTAGVMP